MPPPIAASCAASCRRAPCTRAQRPSSTTQATAMPSSDADTTSSGATPITSTSARVSIGPATAPAVPATAMIGNRRRDCSSLQMSAMKLQNTDTTNRLNTLTQTKNTVPSARGLEQSLVGEQRHEPEQAGDEEDIHHRHHDPSRIARRPVRRTPASAPAWRGRWPHRTRATGSSRPRPDSCSRTGRIT